MKQTGIIVLFAAIIAFGLAGFGPQPIIEEGTYPSPEPFNAEKLVLSAHGAGDQNLQVSAFGIQAEPTLPPLPPSSPIPSCTTAAKYKIALLVDTSGSMGSSGSFNGASSGSTGSSGKLGQLKTALTTLADQFDDSDVVGIQSFNSEVEEIVPIKPYAEIKSDFKSKVNALDTNGSTFMKDGVEFSKKKISEYRAKGESGYDGWALVFMSDGIPSGDRQNPTEAINKLKSEGLRVITIAFGTGADQGLMRSLATDPNTDYFQATSGTDLTDAYSRIIQNISCS